MEVLVLAEPQAARMLLVPDTQGPEWLGPGRSLLLQCLEEAVQSVGQPGWGQVQLGLPFWEHSSCTRFETVALPDRRLDISK